MPFQDHLKEISQLQRGIGEKKFVIVVIVFGVSRVAVAMTLNICVSKYKRSKTQTSIESDGNKDMKNYLILICLPKTNL
ncbi:CLUMA_CG013768, isoform A [Clunio marinus]|uniref:CLUMA_CG013768, isoform A n=1 Tax=Clunio marinus TaxID=568069 RepID=A0A1J1IJU8_9DIPT|nr:CLUMA_CG013768, isoform A [Clunio marinus]